MSRPISLLALLSVSTLGVDSATLVRPFHSVPSAGFSTSARSADQASIASNVTLPISNISHPASDVAHPIFDRSNRADAPHAGDQKPSTLWSRDTADTARQAGRVEANRTPTSARTDGDGRYNVVPETPRRIVGDESVERNEQDSRKTTEREHRNSSSTSSKAGGGIAKSLQDNAAAIKKPIVQTLVTVGSSQCENLKSVLGLTYEQKKDGDREPDVEMLQLVWRHRRSVTIYRISDGELELPRKLNSDRNLVIFIHGFTDDPTKSSFGNISETFLEKGGYNVLALDGSSLIDSLYLRATTYVRFMGEKLGATLAAMVRAGLEPKDVLIVGHSLGSHIAGFTGKTFRKLTGQRLGRISGLDPAGPCFTELEERYRLNRDDADFVDVLHTDAGVYGISESVGQVDFYVNGGYMQPNCYSESCSHSRAWLYYTESVTNPQAFPAKKCQDWRTFERNACGKTDTTFMGFPTPSDVRGDFYLQTRGDPPYGKGSHGLVFDGDKPAAKKVIDAGGDVLHGIKSVAGKVLG